MQYNLKALQLAIAQLHRKAEISEIMQMCISYALSLVLSCCVAYLQLPYRKTLVVKKLWRITAICQVLSPIFTISITFPMQMNFSSPNLFTAKVFYYNMYSYNINFSAMCTLYFIIIQLASYIVTKLASQIVSGQLAKWLSCRKQIIAVQPATYISILTMSCSQKCSTWLQCKETIVVTSIISTHAIL